MACLQLLSKAWNKRQVDKYSELGEQAQNSKVRLNNSVTTFGNENK